MLKYIHQSNLIEGYNDRKMDAQSLLAWDYLKEIDMLTHTVICKLQKMITLPQDNLQPNWRGYYRSVARINVTVGLHTPPGYQFVESLMSNWLLDLDKTDSKINHVKFEDIHPFVDGNGRTGRMLMWWQQLKRGEKLWLIKARDRMEYYEFLEEARKQLND
jgi:Fic family protein